MICLESPLVPPLSPSPLSVCLPPLLLLFLALFSFLHLTSLSSFFLLFVEKNVLLFIRIN